MVGKICIVVLLYGKTGHVSKHEQDHVFARRVPGQDSILGYKELKQTKCMAESVISGHDLSELRRQV